MPEGEIDKQEAELREKLRKAKWKEDVYEKHETELDEVIRQRHNMARVALAVEKLLSKGYIGDLGNAVEEELQEPTDTLWKHLPKPFRDRLFDIAEEYTKQATDMRIAESVIREDIFTMASKDRTKPLSSVEVGNGLFARITNNAPKGRVELIVNEAYGILYCEDNVDYQLFHGKKPKEEKEEKVETGQEAGEEEAEEEEDESGGRFHREVTFPLISDSGDQTLTLLVISGKRTRKNEETIVAHERQHFINHALLDLFTADESLRSYHADKHEHWATAKKHQSTIDGEAVAFKLIKDEVIAFIRGKSSGDFLKSNLKGNLYKHLFQSPHIAEENTQKRAYAAVDDIADALENAEQVFSGRDDRAILVYHLIDVPLSKIGKRIRTLTRWYQREREPISDQFRALVPGGDERLDPGVVYPYAYTKLAREAMVAQNNFDTAWKHTIDSGLLEYVGMKTPPKILHDLQELRADFDQKFSFLQKVPSCTDSTIEYEDKKFKIHEEKDVQPEVVKELWGLRDSVRLYLLEALARLSDDTVIDWYDKTRSEDGGVPTQIRASLETIFTSLGFPDIRFSLASERFRSRAEGFEFRIRYNTAIGGGFQRTLLRFRIPLKS